MANPPRLLLRASALAAALLTVTAVLPSCSPAEWSYQRGQVEPRPTGRAAGAPPTSPTAPLSSDQKERILEAVTEQVKQRAFAAGVDFGKWDAHLAKHKESLDAAETMGAFSRVLNRALNEFGISHIDVLSPRMAETRRETKYGGIGITVALDRDIERDGLVVDEVRPGGPAEKAGLRRGDRIIEVDGKRVNEVGMVRGVEGTPVKIKVVRADGGERELTLTRASLSLAQEPRLTLVGDDAAVLRLPSFTEGYDRAQMQRLVREAAGRPYLVIDLRNNGGGMVENLRHFLSLMLPARTEVGTFVSKRMAREYARKEGAEPTDLAKVAEWTDSKFRVIRNPEGTPYQGKVAVLINSASASASEIFAAAMSELKDAPLVGRKTAGAVLMSQYVKLDDGFEMKVPTSDYVTIKGVRLEGNPLEPTIELGSAYERRFVTVENDQAVKRALEELRSKHPLEAAAPKTEQK